MVVRHIVELCRHEVHARRHRTEFMSSDHAVGDFFLSRYTVEAPSASFLH